MLGLVGLWRIGTDDATARSGSAGVSAAATDDDHLLHEVRALVAAGLALALHVRRHHPALAGPVSRVIEVRRAHLRTLGRADGQGSGRRAPGHLPSVPPDTTSADRLVRASCADLRRALGHACDQARSGDLARVFAAMAAAEGQQLLLVADSPAAAGSAGPRLPVRTQFAGGALAAAQRTLGGEHAAVYAYGVVAAQAVSEPDSQLRAAAAYAVHIRRRDALMAQIAASHADPDAALPAYSLPAHGDAAAAARVGRLVESRCGVLYADLVAGSAGSPRTFARTALLDAADRELTWGGRPSNLPGMSA